MTTIIVEGLDRCGKTTQIKRLMKHLADKPIQVLHYTSIKGLSPEEQTEFFKKTFNHMFELTTDDRAHWILDRSHLGERVYQPLYRPTMNSDYVLELEDTWNISERKDMFLILLYDSTLGNLQREDGDSYTTNPEEVRKEILNFKRAVEESKILNKLVIDIAGKNADAVEQEIDSWLFP